MIPESKPTGGAAVGTPYNDLHFLLRIYLRRAYRAEDEEEDHEEQQPRSFVLSHFMMKAL